MSCVHQHLFCTHTRSHTTHSKLDAFGKEYYRPLVLLVQNVFNTVLTLVVSFSLFCFFILLLLLQTKRNLVFSSVVSVAWGETSQTGPARLYFFIYFGQQQLKVHDFGFVVRTVGISIGVVCSACGDGRVYGKHRRHRLVGSFYFGFVSFCYTHAVCVRAGVQRTTTLSLKCLLLRSLSPSLSLYQSRFVSHSKSLYLSITIQSFQNIKQWDIVRLVNADNNQTIPAASPPP